MNEISRLRSIAEILLRHYNEPIPPLQNIFFLISCDLYWMQNVILIRIDEK